MYTTKPLSFFTSNRQGAPPPEGPASGYLAVKDDDYDGGGNDDVTCCWGAFGRNRVRDLPFPQNRVLKVDYGSDEEDAIFVPVAGQPPASNRYHAVVARGAHRGLVRACSREEENAACCLGCPCINDVKPRPYDPADVYQQMEIVPHRRRRGQFTARAVAADGVPPFLYRAKYWSVYAANPKKFTLREAPGLDAALRSRQLAVDGFPAITTASQAAASSTAVGKWYCPFYVIKEGGVSPKKQMDRAAFYEVSLEQRWEPVLAGDATHGGSELASRRALIGGSVEAKQEGAATSHQHGGGYVWFRAAAGEKVGVCASVWERMLWEEQRGGWVDEEEVAGMMLAGGWVLVERFLVKRMDGSVAVAFDFVHLRSSTKGQ